jgi:hypothetical protein
MVILFIFMHRVRGLIRTMVMRQNLIFPRVRHKTSSIPMRPRFAERDAGARLLGLGAGRDHDHSIPSSPTAAPDAICVLAGAATMPWSPRFAPSA